MESTPTPRKISPRCIAWHSLYFTFHDRVTDTAARNASRAAPFVLSDTLCFANKHASANPVRVASSKLLPVPIGN
jgi:hypothetical protein